MPDPIRHIATYARVSSDEQRDRHTVRNQRAALSRRLGSEPDVLVFKHYEDDGVSGTIPFEERPGGCALVRDARAGRFSQIWVVRADRLGRDAFELLRIWRVFESIGVALRATDENIDDPFYFDIHAVIAANERRKFLERSAEGMNRAAKEGRYTGGIVPLGYCVSGDRGARRLVPDDSLMWEHLSAADVVRRIYDHLAVDGWSCVRIATEFNSLGVPTSYRRDGRGVRGKRTQGLWRSGRIRNLVVNPVYRGLLQYGRRSTKPNGREVISASVSPLVSEDVWNAAIATLKRNRALPRNSCHSYLLRSLIRCAVCGLSFCGTWTRGPRYRCNGSMAHRGPFAGKCIGASIKGEKLEAAVWSDVSRFLLDPQVLVDELLADDSDAENHAIAEAERDSLLANRSAVQDRRTRAIDLYTRAKLSEVEFDAIAADVERELKTLNDRLAVLEPDDDVADDGLSEHVLTEIRQRLTGDLSDSERREIVQLLVRRITVHTTLTGRGPKQVRVVIDYRFPPGGAARTGTGWYPHVSGHRTLWYMLRNHEPNGLRYLKQAGYHVEWWGKNDLLELDSFPSSVSHRGQIDIDRRKMMGNSWPVGHEWRRTFYYGERPAENSNDADRQWIDGAINFLNSNPPEPFCLYLPLFFPHPPYWVEEPYFSMYDRNEVPAPVPVNGHEGKPKYYPEIHQSYDLDQLSEEQYREIVAVYYGMVSRLDDQLGELREALVRNGLADRTATMFFSDHGDYVGDYGLTEKWPTGYEDSLLRVPMVVHAPWLDPQPMSDQLVEIIDVLPTMLELAGVEMEHDQFGKSLMPIVSGEDVELRDAVFCEGGHGDHEHQNLELVNADSDPNFVYYQKARIQTDNPESVCKASMVRTRKWKYIRRAADTDELYDIENDPAELENVVDRPEYADVRHELERRLVQWYLETGDVVPYDKDPRF